MFADALIRKSVIICFLIGKDKMKKQKDKQQ